MFIAWSQPFFALSAFTERGWLDAELFASFVIANGCDEHPDRLVCHDVCDDRSGSLEVQDKFYFVLAERVTNYFQLFA